jgi:GTPase
MNSLPVVAIVGEPNVGKSTLLNKIAGNTTYAVTSPVAGTTRDRQYFDTSWNGVEFTLVDTAGVTFGEEGILENELNKQVDFAVAQADLLIFMVDGKQGVEAIERKTILKFRKTKKPVVLVINKVDSPRKRETIIADFLSLGIKPAFSISSVTGAGIGDLLDHVTNYITEHNLYHPAEKAQGEISVSIIGKPNVGKSSLFNKIIKEDRVVVSPIPGTTRTAIDTTVEFEGTKYTFIDTAGLKRKSHRQELPDRYSSFQTFKSIRRSDICLLLIDATLEITRQDQQLAQEILDMDKGLIIVANKMDEYKGTEDALRDYISHHFPFVRTSPVFYISALTGNGITTTLKAIKPIFEARIKVVPQEDLDRVLANSMKRNPPKLMRDQ